MSVRFITGTPISCTAGVATVLGSSAVVCSTVVLQAATANAGLCYWGSSSLTTANGITLSPGEKVGVTYDLAWGNNTFIPLDALYVTANNTADKVRFIYEQVS